MQSQIIGTDLEDEFTERAFAAYAQSGGTDQPSMGSSTIEKLGDMHYAVLRNMHGTLAVYSIRDGKLRRLDEEDVPSELTV
jgi:hypothetical protein